MKKKNDKFECELCGADVNESDTYCPDCGALFVEGINCKNHPLDEAAGACIICGQAYCKKCGSRVRNLFLCNEHDAYEIYEGMARVFGSSDELETQYAYDALKKNGLHPYVYYRKASPISLGGPDYTLFRASGEYDGHIINEIKVMVPCSEVLQAEKVLGDVELI